MTDDRWMRIELDQANVALWVAIDKKRDEHIKISVAYTNEALKIDSEYAIEYAKFDEVCRKWKTGNYLSDEEKAEWHDAQ